MKTKTFTKKLRLNKSTVSNLSYGEMKAVNGLGLGLYSDNDPTCLFTFCASDCPAITICGSRPCC